MDIVVGENNHVTFPWKNSLLTMFWFTALRLQAEAGIFSQSKLSNWSNHPQLEVSSQTEAQ